MLNHGSSGRSRKGAESGPLGSGTFRTLPNDSDDSVVRQGQGMVGIGALTQWMMSPELFVPLVGL